jgi:hypothetical protein
VRAATLPTRRQRPRKRQRPLHKVLLARQREEARRFGEELLGVEVLQHFDLQTEGFHTGGGGSRKRYKIQATSKIERANIREKRGMASLERRATFIERRTLIETHHGFQLLQLLGLARVHHLHLFENAGIVSGDFQRVLSR